MKSQSRPVAATDPGKNGLAATSLTGNVNEVGIEIPAVDTASETETRTATTPTENAPAATAPNPPPAPAQQTATTPATAPPGAPNTTNPHPNQPHPSQRKTRTRSNAKRGIANVCSRSSSVVTRCRRSRRMIIELGEDGIVGSLGVVVECGALDISMRMRKRGGLLGLRWRGRGGGGISAFLLPLLEWDSWCTVGTIAVGVWYQGRLPP